MKGSAVTAGPEHRKPADMRSWELTSMIRHARALMQFTPNAQLARALVNFTAAAGWELERRGHDNEEYLNSA